MYAVAGGKGGCGKTTTTFEIGRAAARAGRTVLLVDADAHMPNLHLVAGVDREPSLGSGPPSEGAQAVPADSQVGVVSAPRGFSVQSTDLEGRRGVREITLIDCPAGGGPDAVTPLRVADATVLVTTLEPACLSDTKRTAALSRAVGTPVAGVVVSRSSRAPPGLEANLKTPVLGCVPTVSTSMDSPRVRHSHDSIFQALEGRWDYITPHQ